MTTFTISYRETFLDQVRSSHVNSSHVEIDPNIWSKWWNETASVKYRRGS